MVPSKSSETLPKSNHFFTGSHKINIQYIPITYFCVPLLTYTQTHTHTHTHTHTDRHTDMHIYTLTNELTNKHTYKLIN